MLLNHKTEFMNTSNKILSAFLLIIFLVPGLLLMAFKSKIRKDQYTLITRTGYGNNWKTGKFGSNKVVKIEGLAETSALNVNLRYSDTITYGYAGGDHDSIAVRELNDTVLISYKYSGNQPGNARINMDLAMPGTETLVVKDASVNILSVKPGGSGNISMELSGSSRLNIGESPEYDFQGGQSQKAIDINQLSVKMDNSRLQLGNTVSVNELVVEANGNSKLFIHKEVRIESLRGSLSDSSTVDASWNYLKQFSGLPK
jgi:hypothetical protein